MSYEFKPSRDFVVERLASVDHDVRKDERIAIFIKALLIACVVINVVYLIVAARTIPTILSGVGALGLSIFLWVFYGRKHAQYLADMEEIREKWRRML